MKKVFNERITICGAPFLRGGKTADLYSLYDDLLVVRTDRVSAMDIVLNGLVFGKGYVLTQATEIFKRLLKERGIAVDQIFGAESEILFAEADSIKAKLRGRVAVVKKADILPFEMIARGFVVPESGHWKTYTEEHGALIHGHEIPAGIKPYGMLPRAIFTPSTKGDKDENISYRQFVELLREWLKDRKYEIDAEVLAEEIRAKTLKVYAIIRETLSARYEIADIKIEFGLVRDSEGNLVLVVVDEVGTPDTMRIWLKESMQPGVKPEEHDKQGIRDWARGEEDLSVPVPQELLSKAAGKYQEYLDYLSSVSFLC